MTRSQDSEMSVVSHNFVDGGAMVVRARIWDFRACSPSRQAIIARLIFGPESRSKTLYWLGGAAARDARVSSRY